MDMAALQERVTELTAVLRGLQLQVQQAVEAVENLGADLAEAAVVAEWTELAPEPVAELAPEPVAAVAQPAQPVGLSGLNTRKVHYAVLRPGPGYQPGVTRDFGVYTSSLRDHAVSWNGRSRLPKAPGAEGERYQSRGEAETAYRLFMHMGPDQQVPYL